MGPELGREHRGLPWWEPLCVWMEKEGKKCSHCLCLHNKSMVSEARTCSHAEAHTDCMVPAQHGTAQHGTAWHGMACQPKCTCTPAATSIDPALCLTHSILKMLWHLYPLAGASCSVRGMELSSEGRHVQEGMLLPRTSYTRDAWTCVVSIADPLADLMMGEPATR